MHNIASGWSQGVEQRVYVFIRQSLDILTNHEASPCEKVIWNEVGYRVAMTTRRIKHRMEPAYTKQLNRGVNHRFKYVVGLL